MYTLLKAIYSKYCGHPEYNVAILGIENTGKTVMIILSSKYSKPSNKYKMSTKFPSPATINLQLDSIVPIN